MGVRSEILLLEISVSKLRCKNSQRSSSACSSLPLLIRTGGIKTGETFTRDHSTIHCIKASVDKNRSRSPDYCGGSNMMALHNFMKGARK